MSRKGEYIKFNNFKRNIKSSFMIFSNFESFLVAEGNGNQNPDEFHRNKY